MAFEIKRVFVFDKATPGTRRYKEVVPDTNEPPAIVTIYLRKPGADKLGDTIVVTVRNWTPEDE